MKKAWAVLGILFLLIGLVSISSSSVQEKENNMQLVKKVEKQWNISGNFQKGQNLSLYFYQHADWSRPPWGLDLSEYPNSKLLWVNITNIAANSYTLIEVVLIPPEPPKEPYAYVLTVYSMDVIHHGAITIEDQPKEINGIAKNNGSYLVNCSLIPDIVVEKDFEGNPIAHPASPPPELYLYVKTTEMKHSYNFLLPTGTSLSIIGLIVSIWGAKSKKRKTTYKSSKRHIRADTCHFHQSRSEGVNQLARARI